MLRRDNAGEWKIRTAVDSDDTNECIGSFVPDAERAAAPCDLLQLLDIAAILVDRDGEVVGLNDAARGCIGAGIHIRNRRLVAADPEARRALAQMIGDTGAGSAVPGGGEQVVIARPSMRPLILRTIPLQGLAAAMCHPARAIVVLLDAARVSLPTEAQLKRAFDLSEGEARLAIRLAAGQPLETAAGVCGISYETARKRLKVVFEKTDTCRQSELVGLIIRLGGLAGTPRPIPAEPMPLRPRHRSIDKVAALRRQLPQPQLLPRSDRWTSTA